MTILKHELKTGRNQLIIWAAAVSFLLVICVLIYPEMSSQMGEISDTFAQMGGFTQAFGMDKVNFGEFLGFFGVECGNILGLGGAFFAALIGISALAKEEKEHTAEFLLTHPISRSKILTEKLLAVVVQLVIFNAAVIAVTGAAILIIGEEPDTKTLALLYLSYFLMQIETAAVSFGISAFLKRGAIGVGIGISAVFYFMNIISNLTENAEILKYFTPFGYTDSADIIVDNSIDPGYLAAGAGIAFAGIVCSYVKYLKKDIS
ncbi:MAG: ABC transporter permease subunit [Oscillospiraceae bacterium]|nr:ABC transporter permease subunit [Oscillospiraceae bacterium]